MLTDDDVVDVGKQAGFEANEIQAYISKQENLDHVVRTAKSWADKGVEGNIQNVFCARCAKEYEIFESGCLWRCYCF